MIPDRIEREVVIDASLDTVWALVTDAEHVGTWFSDAAELDLRSGGAGTLTWKEHGTVRVRVEKVEPQHTFSFRWARPIGDEPREGNSTLVEFSLSEEGKGTRLRVVESGFRELDLPEDEKAAYAEENSEGWKLELGELREYVSTLADASTRG